MLAVGGFCRFTHTEGGILFRRMSAADPSSQPKLKDLHRPGFGDDSFGRFDIADALVPNEGRTSCFGNMSVS
jgi:hypothetical protein